MLEEVDLGLLHWRRVGEGPVAEEVLPDLVRHLFRGNSSGTGLGALQIVLVQELSDGVVRHIYGGVTEGFDEEVRVPGELGTETVSARTGPLVEPVEGLLECVTRFGGVSVHLSKQPVCRE